MTQGFNTIEAPTFTPLRYGLLSAVQFPEDSDGHWQLGVQTQVDPCVTPAVVTGGPCSASGVTKTPTASGAPVTAAQPFTVYAWLPCSPIGQGNDLEDLRRRTTRMLTNGEGRAVEHTFWTGAASNGTILPHLAEDTQVFADPQGSQPLELQSAATVVSGSPTSLMEGLALLEGSLAACYGGEGVIHVPAGVVAHLSNVGVVTKQGPQLRTLMGNIVAAYASGDREGPTGANPPTGQTWLYATGAVFGRRSAIKDTGVSPAAIIGIREPGGGAGQNNTVYIVERTYVLDWDCCHFATLVTSTGLGT